MPRAWILSTSRTVARVAARGREMQKPRTISLTGMDHTSILLQMSRAVKKITANIPVELLERAQRATGLGITETLVAGLEELQRTQKRSALRALRGRVKIELDLESTRQ